MSCRLGSSRLVSPRLVSSRLVSSRHVSSRLVSSRLVSSRPVSSRLVSFRLVLSKCMEQDTRVLRWRDSTLALIRTVSLVGPNTIFWNTLLKKNTDWIASGGTSRQNRAESAAYLKACTKKHNWVRFVMSHGAASNGMDCPRYLCVTYFTNGIVVYITAIG